MRAFVLACLAFTAAQPAGAQSLPAQPGADRADSDVEVIPAATVAEEEFAGPFFGGRDVIVDRSPGLFCHFELNRLARLLLADGCPIDRDHEGDVFDTQADDVASSGLAIDS